MKKILVALLATASVAAFADSDLNNIYITGAVGVTGNSALNTGANTGEKMSLGGNSQATMGLNIGYNFSKNLGLEAGYTDFVSRTPNQQLGVTDLAVRGTLPLNDTFSLFGRLGLAGYSAPANDSISVDTLGALFGMGAEFNLNKSWALTAEYWGVTGVSGTNVQVGAKYGF